MGKYTPKSSNKMSGPQSVQTGKIGVYNQKKINILNIAESQGVGTGDPLSVFYSYGSVSFYLYHLALLLGYICCIALLHHYTSCLALLLGYTSVVWFYFFIIPSLSCISSPALQPYLLSCSAAWPYLYHQAMFSGHSFTIQHCCLSVLLPPRLTVGHPSVSWLCYLVMPVVSSYILPLYVCMLSSPTTWQYIWFWALYCLVIYLASGCTAW